MLQNVDVSRANPLEESMAPRLHSPKVLCKCWLRSTLGKPSLQRQLTASAAGREPEDHSLTSRISTFIHTYIESYMIDSTQLQTSPKLSNSSANLFQSASTLETHSIPTAEAPGSGIQLVVDLPPCIALNQVGSRRIRRFADLGALVPSGGAEISEDR